MEQRRHHRLWVLLVLTALLAGAFAMGTPHTSALAPPWDGNFHPYAVGDLVSFNGNEYQCIQAHTSQPTWTPEAVPALWKLSPPSGGTATATSASTATATRVATATPTRVG